MPGFTAAFVTVAEPEFPVIVVGPVAVRFTDEAATVPPLSLVTVLVSVSTGEISLLLMVQVAVWPKANTRLLPVKVPPVQLHAPAA